MSQIAGYIHAWLEVGESGKRSGCVTHDTAKTTCIWNTETIRKQIDRIQRKESIYMWTVNVDVLNTYTYIAVSTTVDRSYFGSADYMQCGCYVCYWIELPLYSLKSHNESYQAHIKYLNMGFDSGIFCYKIFCWKCVKNCMFTFCICCKDRTTQNVSELIFRWYSRSVGVCRTNVMKGVFIEFFILSFEKMLDFFIWFFITICPI